ncbi:MAG: putative adenylylsulfate kinase [Bacteroidetes bacterium]|nr:putative adenylylsulfate kinase [Bacteroidota bacterium]
MTQSERNIHPSFDQFVSRHNKEWLLQQRSKVVWLTGLSGSGKTTIAKGVERVLFEMGHITMILDGDNVRAGINNNLGFSPDDRKENIRRIAETARLFLDSGIVTICSFVSPMEEMRQAAASIIGKNDFIEVYINTPLAECERRDVKGLYAKARKGEIKDFTGINAPFEVPAHPALEIMTKGQTVEDSVRQLLEYVVPLIQHDGVR